MAQNRNDRMNWKAGDIVWDTPVKKTPAKKTSKPSKTASKKGKK